MEPIIEEDSTATELRHRVDGLAVLLTQAGSCYQDDRSLVAISSCENRSKRIEVAPMTDPRRDERDPTYAAPYPHDLTGERTQDIPGQQLDVRSLKRWEAD